MNIKSILVVISIIICGSCINNDDNILFNNYAVGDISPNGWMKNQMLGDLREGFAGHLDELTKRAGDSVFINHRGLDWDGGDWKRDPRLKEYPDMFRWWDGETEGNWRIGLVEMAYLSNEPVAIAKISSYLDAVVEKSYTDDGYIGMFAPSTRYKSIGDLWGQSLILKALISYYYLTDNSKVLAAVTTAVDKMMEAYNVFGEHKNIYDINRNGHSLSSYTDVAEELYNITGDSKYLHLVKVLYDDFSKSEMIAGSKESCRECTDLQLQELLDPNKPFCEHSAHVVEQIRTPLFLKYHFPNENIYSECVRMAMTKLSPCITPSGNCIGDEWIFGRIGSPNIGHEYCVMTELLATYISYIQKFGDMKFADEIEKLVFNAAQSARLPNGKAISYITTDNRIKAIGNGCYYSPTHEERAVCCNPNAVKFLPLYVKNMWMKFSKGSEEGVACLLYGPSTLTTEYKGEKLTIEQRTEYPADEKIDFVIKTNCKNNIPVAFRIPEWCDDMDILSEGAKISKNTNDMVIVKKKWKDGDIITVTFSSSIKQHISSNGEHFFTKGPLLYALPLEQNENKLRNRKYPVDGFYDIEYELMDKSNDTIFYVSKYSIDSMKYRVIISSQDDIWDTPKSKIEVELLKAGEGVGKYELVPIGNTVLRKATFPMTRFNY